MESSKFNPICPNCYSFCLITILNSSLSFNCKCGYSKSLSIKDYYNLLEANKLSISKTNVNRILCRRHSNKFSYYCSDCKEQFCAKCLSFHNEDYKNHNIQKYIEILPIELIKEKIQQVYNHIEIYFRLLKNKPQKCYEEKKEELTEVVEFVQKLVDNYNSESPNYYINMNILHNTNFLIYKCKDEDNSDAVMTYLGEYSLIAHSLKEVKTVQIEKGINDICEAQGGKLLCVDSKGVISYREKNDMNKVQELKEKNEEEESEEKSDEEEEEEEHEEKNKVIYVTQLPNGNIVAGEKKPILKIYSFDGSYLKIEKEIKYQYEDTTSPIVLLSNDQMAGYEKNQIFIWSTKQPYSNDEIHSFTIEELRKGEKIDTIQGIYQIGTQPYLYVGTSEKLLKISMKSTRVYDYTTVKRLKGINCSGCFLQLNEKQLLIGGKDKIYLFRLTQFAIEEEINLDGIGSIVHFIKFDNRVLFSSDSGVIGIYNVISKEIELYYTGMRLVKIIKDSDDTIIAISDNKLIIYKII